MEKLSRKTAKRHFEEECHIVLRVFNSRIKVMSLITKTFKKIREIN